MARKPDTVSDSATHSQAVPSFEDALAELERIVAAMESGQMPLQESLDAYRRGMNLLNQCRNTLDAAEHQLRVLENGSLRDVDSQRAADLPAEED